MKFILTAALSLSLLFGATNVFAGDIRVVNVQFKPNKTGTTIKGSIKGRQTIDYRLKARSGQQMTVSLDTTNLSNYFNVLPPGSETALFVGSTSGNKWTGTLPKDGDYTIRVYLMRSAARRNEKAHYTLTVGIAGEALGAARKGDAKVPGTPYHATGLVPCSVGPDPKGSAQCSFGVIRGAHGNAEFYLADPGFDVTLHKDHLRVLRFIGGKVTSADSKARVTAEKRGDEWSVSIDGFYFYTITEADIVGD
jgi:hypothetical protein